MRKYLSIIVLLLFVNFGFSQREPQGECGYFGKKDIKERNNTFPFNEAKKVVLVAYPSPYSIIIDEKDNQVANDSLNLSDQFKVIKVINLPESSIKYCITEKIELNQAQINELSHLLVNYTFEKKSDEPLLITGIGCYEPRNAILFTDEDDNVISYIEVCFECIQFYQLPDETIPDFNTICKIEECFGMVNLIKDFFRKTGIQYGVVEE